MDRIMGVVNKVPLWVRTIVACVGIICVAVVVDHFVQDYVYKNKYNIVKDDFSHMFQIDSIEQSKKELFLSGWIFKLGEDSLENDFEVILYDYDREKEYYMQIEDVIREDVNEYFKCEFDYSNSGFIAKIKLGKVDLHKRNYEILIRPKKVRKAYKTGIYISNGEIMYVKPEEYISLDLEGTELEEIVNNGVLRVFRPDVGMYVFQYNGELYWIADSNYKFFMESSTPIAFQLWTTQIEKLPEYRLENNWFFDNITFSFEHNEMFKEGNYRITKAKIPKEYSIIQIETGQYVEEWLWNQHFRPWYVFD